MQIGKFPTREFLQKYNLEKEYWDITEACLNGDI
jgi:hypothetical protein